MLMKEIFLIRHGETEYNRQGIVQGSGVDMPLNKNGWLQAQAFFNCYRHLSFDQVVHSNLQRSKQTVAPFVDLGVPALELPHIREISWGVYEGKPYNEAMKGDYNTMISAWANDDLHASMPGGESAAELLNRVRVGLDLVLSLEAQKILVCSHGRTIRAFMCVVQDLHARHMEDFKHSNTGLYKIHYIRPKLEVVSFNDVTHLQAIEI